MKYSEEFIEYVNICIKHNQFIGIGNPNAPILIICNDIKTDLLSVDEYWYNKNNEYWLENIQLRKKRQDIGLELFPSQNSLLYKKQHRWNTYQELHDYIYKEDLISLTNDDIPLWFHEYFIYETVEEMRMGFIYGEKSLKPMNEHRIDFLERTFIIELPIRKIQDTIFETEFFKEFAFYLIDGNLLSKEEADSILDQVGEYKSPGVLYKVAKNVTLYESTPIFYKIFFIEKWEDLTIKSIQIIAFLLRFNLYKEMPIIDGHHVGNKFIRRNGFKTPAGNAIPATTRLKMNFEGMAEYQTEVIDVLQIPLKYFQKEWAINKLPNPIPSDYIIEIKDDRLKFEIISKLQTYNETFEYEYAFENIDLIDNTNITYADLQKIKSIDYDVCFFSEIPFRDISALQHCHNLENISFTEDGCLTINVEQLRQLEKIKTFELISFSLTLTDLEFIKNWHNLEELTLVCHISRSYIKDISALMYVPKLKRLHLDLHESCDLTPIKRLKNIEYLELNNVIWDSVNEIKGFKI